MGEERERRSFIIVSVGGMRFKIAVVIMEGIKGWKLLRRRIISFNI